MENKWLHESGANIMVYNVAIKGSPQLSRIFIWTSLVCSAVTKCQSEISMYLSVYTNEPHIKSEIYGLVLQVAPESKIQLVSCKLSLSFILGIYALVYIRAI